MFPMDRLSGWPGMWARLVALGKFVAKAIAFSLVLFLVFLIAFQGHLIDDIYKNVDDLNDGEMPTTVTSYPSGPEVVGIIGGSGEGLNCSLPRLLDVFFDGSPDLLGNRHLVRQQFRQACVAHDLCYRHGLATYGYSQNDCDRILQNQAFRLCKYIRGEEKRNEVRSEEKLNKDTAAVSDRCQQDSKRLLAGVSIGGFGSYRAWDRSTYFEFDSDPTRSNFFSVSRVVDHPFKSADPAKYQNDPPQVILTFANKHFGLTAHCATCKTAKREPPHPIWLPPRRDHAAPHLLVDGAGKHHLIWMSRVTPENTGSCVVWADAEKLLTDTFPKRDLCNAGARSPLTLVQADMYASSPLPLVLPEGSSPNNIIATGLSPQRDRDHSLRLCIWSERIRKTGHDTGSDDSVCRPLHDHSIDAGRGLGALQNFAVVRPGQQIFFARNVALLRASNRLIGFFENAIGDVYSTRGSLVVVDVSGPTVTAEDPGIAKIKKIVPFAIDDRFDPMMPMTRTKDDLRFVSLLTSKTRLDVYVTDFANDNPVPRPIGLTMGGAPLDLHPSWALRPALVVESSEPARTTKLVLSRGHLITAPDRLVDTVRLEILILEPDAPEPADKPFSVTSGTACTVKYTFKKANADRICQRGFEPSRPMRPSPATMMMASQLLVGRFGGGEGLGLAFADYCLDQYPITLVPGVESKQVFTETARNTEQQNVAREVVCMPLDARESIGREMSE
jgi:hypothetical protein